MPKKIKFILKNKQMSDYKLFIICSKQLIPHKKNSL